MALTNRYLVRESWPVTTKRPIRLRFALVAAAALVGGGSCYEMNVRPTQLGSIQHADRCNDFLVDQLAHLGYGRVQRVSGTTHTMFSKDPSVAQQTPLNMLSPGPLGGLIALRITRRDDDGCVVEMVPATYDCLSASPSDMYARCELTPGGSADVEADIAQVAAAFRNRFKN